LAEIFINQGDYLQKVIKYASVSSSTWYSRKQHVKEDKRKNNPERPVPGYTINPDGSIVLDELIVSVLEQYRNKKKPRTKRSINRLIADPHQVWELEVYPWKTICFSKLEKMHDIVIGLLINKVEFGLDIHA